MKILKSIFILTLFLFSNFIISCTADDITEEQETIATENIQATGGEGAEVDQTEKG